MSHQPYGSGLMDAIWLSLLAIPLFFFLLQLLFSIAIWRAAGCDPLDYKEPEKTRRNNGGDYLDSSRSRFRKAFTY